jgi:hypothetical protein
MTWKCVFLGALVLVGCVPHTESDSVNAPASSSPPAVSAASPPPVPQTQASAIASSTPKVDAAPKQEKPLDSVAATKAAQAAGMKASLFVPNPATCPTVPKPTGDATILQAKGKLAGLVVDIEGFLRADVGVPEAVALLGAPVLCNRSQVAGYFDMHLAPSVANVHQVTIETHDGDVIGIVVEFEKPVTVNVAALEKPYGKSRKTPGPLDSFEAGSDVFSHQNSAFQAQLMFAHRDHKDPPTARQVHQIIFRRTSMVQILPDGFQSTPDVVRLVTLALWKKAPEPIAFAGTLGLYQKPVNQRMTFGEAIPIRNVQSAAIGVRPVSDREFLQLLQVVFKKPVPLDAQAFARGLGASLGVAAPAVITEGTRRKLDVMDGAKKRGSVVLEVEAGGIRSLEVIRED